MTLMGAAALLILILTYAGVAIGRIPGLRLDRAGVALLGGAAMIAIG
ncbi:MAG: anion transporter, partial [Mesorhizobium sp.]